MTQEELLRLIPLEATRVKVLSAKGQQKYRSISPREGDFDAVLPSDTIVLNNGKPITMAKNPGRRKGSPPKIAPTTVLNAERQKKKAEFVAKDGLLRRVKKDLRLDPENVLLMVAQRLAQEVASLEFEKLQAEAEGRSTSQLSHRRTAALKTLTDTYSRAISGGVPYRKFKHVRAKLDHVQVTLEVLREEMKAELDPTGIIVLEANWENIIQGLCEELDMEP